MGDSFWTLIAIAGLTVVTIVTRSLFLWPERSIPFPTWLQRGMRFMPLAALMASAAPQIVLTDGQWSADWKDPKVLATLASALAFYWRRDILTTILAGAAVMLILRAGLGW